MEKEIQRTINGDYVMADCRDRCDETLDRVQAKDIEDLLNFGVNNFKLDRLEHLIDGFNPFRVLGVQELEIKHSNMLAYLLNPAENHGFGDIIFKKILLTILKEDKDNYIITAIDATYSDLKVMREWRNIDILCVSQSNKLVLLIENKINADESSGQLQKYADIIDEKYPSPCYKKIFVYLTLDGNNPSRCFYVPFSHKQIYGIVQSVLEIRKSDINSEVYSFAKQYLSVLEGINMPSQDMITLCGKLYREHRRAIELILAYGKPKLSTENIRYFHSKTDTESVHADKDSIISYYTFVPKSWSKVPKTNLDRQDTYLIFFCFDFRAYKDHKLNLLLRVGEFPDPNEREQFIEQLDMAATANQDCKLTVKKTSKAYTTIYNKSISLAYGSNDECDLDDYETVTDKMIEIYKSSELQKALKVVDSVIQNFNFKNT